MRFLLHVPDGNLITPDASCQQQRLITSHLHGGNCLVAWAKQLGRRQETVLLYSVVHLGTGDTGNEDQRAPRVFIPFLDDT